MVKTITITETEATARFDSDRWVRRMRTPLLFEEHLPSSGLLPPVVRWISPKRNALLLERPPTIMPARFIDKMKREAKRSQEPRDIYNIPLPWQIYYAAVHSYGGYASAHLQLHMFVRTSPLDVIDDAPLKIYPLPNVNPEDGIVCAAEELRKVSLEEYKKTSLANIALKMINGFWNSGFNRNLNGWESYRRPREWKGEDGKILRGTDLLEFLDRSSIDDAMSWTYPTVDIGTTLSELTKKTQHLSGFNRLFQMIWDQNG